MLTSCGQHDYKLFFIFDNVDGLTAKSEVTSNGLKIGIVDKLQLFKNKVLVTAIMDESVQIPKNSNVFIQSNGLLGQKIISVVLDTTATIYHVDKDTIYGKVHMELLSDSTRFRIDSTTVKNLKPLVDTLANAIRDFGRKISNDKQKEQ